MSDNETQDTTKLRRDAVRIAGQIRAYWKDLGYDVTVSVSQSGEIQSDLGAGGMPVKRTLG